MSTRVLVMAGTRKGGFILESDEARKDWKVHGPFCNSWEVMDMKHDPKTRAIYAASYEETWPKTIPAVWKTTDMGSTWTRSSEGITYGEEGPKMLKVWHLMPANGALYAGAEPAGLFRSDDGGQTWSHVQGLREHPSTPGWMPGNGGLCLHSIVPHPTDPQQMWVAISAVGAFHTTDGGATWEPRNKGIRDPYAPTPVPEVGR